MFLRFIGVSLAESFNLVSNVWYVEIMTQTVIGDVSSCGDDDSEVSVLKSLKFLRLNWRPTVGRHRPK